MTAMSASYPVRSADKCSIACGFMIAAAFKTYIVSRNSTLFLNRNDAAVRRTTSTRTRGRFVRQKPAVALLPTTAGISFRFGIPRHCLLSVLVGRQYGACE